MITPEEINTLSSEDKRQILHMLQNDPELAETPPASSRPQPFKFPSRRPRSISWEDSPRILNSDIAPLNYKLRA